MKAIGPDIIKRFILKVEDAGFLRSPCYRFQLVIGKELMKYLYRRKDDESHRRTVGYH